MWGGAHSFLLSSAFCLSSSMLMLPFLSTPMGTMRMPACTSLNLSPLLSATEIYAPQNPHVSSTSCLHQRIASTALQIGTRVLDTTQASQSLTTDDKARRREE